MKLDKRLIYIVSNKTRGKILLNLGITAVVLVAFLYTFCKCSSKFTLLFSNNPRCFLEFV